MELDIATRKKIRSGAVNEKRTGAGNWGKAWFLKTIYLVLILIEYLLINKIYLDVTINEIEKKISFLR